MKPSRQHIISGAGVVLVLVLILVLSLDGIFAARVSVKYQGAELDPLNGTMGVFELVNNSESALICSDGVFGQRVGGRWDYRASRGMSDIALLGEQRTFSAGSTNTIRVKTPTSGGPYRLMLPCMREEAIRSPNPLRKRMARLVEKTGQANIASYLLGFENPVSQEFMGQAAQVSRDNNHSPGR